MVTKASPVNGKTARFQERGAMLYFKACPRCKGTMADDGDESGPYVHCLNCGYHKDLPASPRYRRVTSGWNDEREGVFAS